MTDSTAYATKRASSPDYTLQPNSQVIENHIKVPTVGNF